MMMSGRAVLSTAMLIVALAAPVVPAWAKAAPRPAALDEARETALDLLALEACRVDWNSRIMQPQPGHRGPDASLVIDAPTRASRDMQEGGRPVVSYDYYSNLLPDYKVCGSFAVPDIGDATHPGANVVLQEMIFAKDHALFERAAREMLSTAVNEPSDKADRIALLSGLVTDALDAYATDEAAAERLLPEMPKGRYLPIIHPAAHHTHDHPSGLYASYCRLTGSDNDEAWDFLDHVVGTDLDQFDKLAQRLDLGSR